MRWHLWFISFLNFGLMVNSLVMGKRGAAAISLIGVIIPILTYWVLKIRGRTTRFYPNIDIILFDDDTSATIIVTDDHLEYMTIRKLDLGGSITVSNKTVHIPASIQWSGNTITSSTIQWSGNTITPSTPNTSNSGIYYQP